MKVSKRIIRMPEPLATEEEEAIIRRFLFDFKRSFSSVAIQGVLELIERERKAAAKAPQETRAMAEDIADRARRINRDRASA